MEFKYFKNLMQNHVAKMLHDQETLFVVDTDKDILWNLYLDSFPEGTNKVFRERREFDCHCCRQFIRNFGNVVVIKDNKVETLWVFSTQDTTYQPVIDALSTYVKSKIIVDTDLCLTKLDINHYLTFCLHEDNKNYLFNINEIVKLIRQPIPEKKIPSVVEIPETLYDEQQVMLREIDRQRRKEDPDFKGAFHEKRERPHNAAKVEKQIEKNKPYKNQYDFFLLIT
jgi:hypothetical protein